MTCVISTIPELCKRCYCCVRECPANAIQIQNGQAVVLSTRCVGCGNCIKVCTQHAKAIQDAVSGLVEQLGCAEPKEKIALVAPSFPAAFPEVQPLQVIGALRTAGFTRVVEVAFGADLVSEAYREHIENTQAPVITTPCPAIVEYIQMYQPELLPNLAPIVSPMIAAGKVVREKYGKDAMVAFIGPCVAKKLEILDSEVAGIVNEALTFDECIELFSRMNINPADEQEVEFDQPRANLGQIYPVSGGLLKSAGIGADVMDEEVIIVEGRQRCMNIISEIAHGKVNSRLIDILFCEGCINGPGISSPLNYFEKRERIISWTKSRRDSLNKAIWRNSMQTWQDVDLSRDYENKRVQERIPEEEEILRILAVMKKRDPSEQINCAACGYASCRELAIAVAQGIAEKEMCLQYTIDNLEQSHRELAEAQAQLIQTEKLASVGQLAAGVAHEINNPLGTIVLYSHLLLKQLQDSDPARDDINFIIAEAERCKNITASLLNFARQGKLVVGESSAGELLNYIRMMIGRREDFAHIDVVIDVDDQLPPLYIDKDQMKQVLLNLALNACEAMPEGGTLTLSATASESPREIMFRVSDTGVGISKENMSRLFTPFFTTKQIGKGTGLGLPIAYGIVKLHHGRIAVQSEVMKGTTFTIIMPMDLRDYPAGKPMSPVELAEALAPNALTKVST
jgi:two-component system, NtrC family, sensor kinase